MLYTSNFNATINRQLFAFKFQFRVLGRFEARDTVKRVRGLLTATNAEVLDLQCGWLRKGRKTAVSSHQFVGAFIGRMTL